MTSTNPADPNWHARYRAHFIRTFVLAACFLVSEFLEPVLTYWPAFVLRWLFLCAALVSAALVGHAASMAKVFPYRKPKTEPKKWIEI